MAKRGGRRRTPRARDQRRSAKMVFGRRNYILILVGVLAITIGFVIMRLENEVDGVISLYVAPIIILAGYLEVLYAIMVSPDKESSEFRVESSE